jgi:hypothetical protein
MNLWLLVLLLLVLLLLVLLLLVLLLLVTRVKRLIVGMVLLGSSINRWIRELLMLLLLLLLLLRLRLLLLLLVLTWLRHCSERVWWEVRVHVDDTVRAVLHICGTRLDTGHVEM